MVIHVIEDSDIFVTELIFLYISYTITSKKSSTHAQVVKKQANTVWNKRNPRNCGGLKPVFEADEAAFAEPAARDALGDNAMFSKRFLSFSRPNPVLAE